MDKQSSPVEKDVNGSHDHLRFGTLVTGDLLDQLTINFVS